MGLMTCISCGGEGTIMGKKCPLCHGTGQIRDDEETGLLNRYF